MKQIVTLDEIYVENRTISYVTSVYGVSATTAWRLLSGKVDHICPGYHIKTVDIDSWDCLTDVVCNSTTVMRYLRNYVARQLQICRLQPSRFIDDISQECYINAYLCSGVWNNLILEKKRKYLKTLAIRTTNQYLKKELHYTDAFKNCKNEKQLYI